MHVTELFGCSLWRTEYLLAWVLVYMLSGIMERIEYEYVVFWSLVRARIERNKRRSQSPTINGHCEGHPKNKTE